MAPWIFALLTLSAATAHSHAPATAVRLQEAAFAAPSSHYADPCAAAGCKLGEHPVSVTGVPGSFCSPKCVGTGAANCPTDVPAGVSATPSCALTAPSGTKSCALVCSPSAAIAIADQHAADAMCGAGASCKPIQGQGLCTYDDCGPSPEPTPPPAPTPPMAPTPPPTPPAPGAASWYRLPFQREIIFGIGAASADVAFVPFTGADGASGVLKSVDGGASFRACNTSAFKSVILLAAAAQSATSAVVTGVLGEHFTADGERFVDSIAAAIPATAQSVKALRGGGGGSLKYGMAGQFGLHTNGVAVSESGGLRWAHLYDVGNSTGLDPQTYPARYADFPSSNVWYVTMGIFPTATPQEAAAPAAEVAGGSSSSRSSSSDSDEELVHRVSQRLGVWRHRVTGARRVRIARRPAAGTAGAAGAAGDGYAAAIVKTTDGGATFTVQLQDSTGGFYPNGISCGSEANCVAAAEGSAGGMLYATADGGTTWARTLFEAGASCMDAQFVGPGEVWAACGVADGPGSADAHFWHSTDGGRSWSKVVLAGGLPVALGMVDPDNGWAAIAADSGCHVAKFSKTPPTPPPTPPPSPPRPGQTHYGDPYVGSCESDEQNVTITGMAGALCAPLCSEPGDGCPSDVPAQVVAVPQCLLSDPDTGVKLCALVCSLGSSGVEADDDQCGPKASCKQPAGSNAGICSYDDLAPPTPPPPTPKPTPPPPPTPPTPRPPGHYDNPYTGACLPDEKNITTRDNSWSTCSPPCTGVLKKRTCPMDGPPSGNSTGGGEIGCALEDDEGTHYCAITCTENKDCPYAASCDIDMVPILGFGLCGYNPPVART